MKPHGSPGRLSTILLLTWLLSSGCGLFSRDADPTTIPPVPTTLPTRFPTVALATALTVPPTMTGTPTYGPPFTPAPTYGPPFSTPVIPTEAVTASTPITTGTSTIGPPPTEEEAEAVVQAYFAAIDADSYDDARALTTGAATEQTDVGAEQIRREATAEGVTVDLRVAELATQGLPPGFEDSRVQTDYVVEAWVDTGLFGDVKARESRGSTVFRTVRTPTGIKIARIEGGLFPPTE